MPKAIAALGLVVLAGCTVPIPNGLFGCGQQSDCPTGYFCWSSDSRCYDAEEPACVPKSCEQVIGEFASLGIPIECGSLPDGCDGSIECGPCPAGTQCGANGQNFLCGCEELTCASFADGAECGMVATRCGGSGQELDCGECFGEQVCEGNKCVCPPGVDCDQGCGGCEDGQVCVEGECCAPTFPCSQNECSPPGGLDDGCGGVAVCPPCADTEQCVVGDDLAFECVGDCTCEAQGIECGSATICGQPTLCGTCQDAGYPEGFGCSGNRCTCEDPFEYNDTFDTFSVICGGSGGFDCLQDAWGLRLEATLHHEGDIDNYGLEVLDTDTFLVAEMIFGPSGLHGFSITYVCPDGSVGIEACSGVTKTIGGLKFCHADGGPVALSRQCQASAASDVGTFLVSVRSAGTANACDPYELNLFATYGAVEVP